MHDGKFDFEELNRLNPLVTGKSNVSMDEGYKKLYLKWFRMLPRIVWLFLFVISFPMMLVYIKFIVSLELGEFKLFLMSVIPVLLYQLLIWFIHWVLAVSLSQKIVETDCLLKLNKTAELIAMGMKEKSDNGVDRGNKVDKEEPEDEVLKYYSE